MNNRTLARAFAVVGAVSLALTACSSGDSGETVPAEETEGTAEAVATDCEPPQATAGATKDTAPLKIGTLLPETGTLCVPRPAHDCGRAGGRQ